MGGDKPRPYTIPDSNYDLASVKRPYTPILSFDCPKWDNFFALAVPNGTTSGQKLSQMGQNGIIAVPNGTIELEAKTVRMAKSACRGCISPLGAILGQKLYDSMQENT